MIEGAGKRGAGLDQNRWPDNFRMWVPIWSESVSLGQRVAKIADQPASSRMNLLCGSRPSPFFRARGSAGGEGAGGVMSA